DCINRQAKTGHGQDGDFSIADEGETGGVI
ncbi:hypothetical protein A2U01_0109318, partial [Trifolium medium]|nr:hypothetical protein [Trifolium medium]